MDHVHVFYISHPLTWDFLEPRTCAAWQSVLGYSCCHLGSFRYCTFPGQHQCDLQLLLRVTQKKIKQKKKAKCSLTLWGHMSFNHCKIFSQQLSQIPEGLMFQEDVVSGCTPYSCERVLAHLVEKMYGPIQGASHCTALSLEINSSSSIHIMYPCCPFSNKTLQKLGLKISIYLKKYCFYCNVSRMLGLKGNFSLCLMLAFCLKIVNQFLVL